MYLMRRAALWAAAAGLAGSVAAGCSTDTPGGAAPATTQPLPAAGAGCKKKLGDGKQVRFGEDSYLAGVLAGTGTTGVLLAHQNNSNVCEWLPYVTELATAGYRVLAFDFAGEGASGLKSGSQNIAADAVAAAQYLKSQGATKLVLMGASKGGTAMLAATQELGADVAGVVTFSAPTAFAGVDASGLLAKLTVPVLYLAGTGDGRFPTEARYFAEHTPKGLATLVLVDSVHHGAPLMLRAGPGQQEIKAAVAAFLKEHAPV